MSSHHWNVGQENENERRKRSFVIIGLPELPSHSEAEKVEQDVLAALDIVRYLGVEDALMPSDVKRVGNGRRGHRALFITLNSIQSRDNVLKHKYFLRRNFNTSDLRLYAAFTEETHPRNRRGDGEQNNDDHRNQARDYQDHRSSYYNHQYNEQGRTSGNDNRIRDDRNSSEPGPSSSRRNYPQNRQ